jgi:hypothetical protein
MRAERFAGLRIEDRLDEPFRLAEHDDLAKRDILPADCTNYLFSKPHIYSRIGCKAAQDVKSKVEVHSLNCTFADIRNRVVTIGVTTMQRANDIRVIMKRLFFMTAIFAIVLSFGALFVAQSQDRSRHFDSGDFTLSPGDTADLTEEHVLLTFVKIWPHPFGNRAINITLDGQSFTIGAGSRIDLKSPFSRVQSERSENAFSGTDHCNLDVVSFENPQEGNPQVTFQLDCV